MKSYNRTFTRRAFIVFATQCAFFCLIVVRLFFLQIVRGRKFKLLSRKNCLKTLALDPPRGLITDRNGVALADNILTHQLFFYKERGIPFDHTIQSTCTILRKDAEGCAAYFDLVRQAKFLYPVRLERDLSWKEVARLNAKLHLLPGLHLDKNYARHYPFGSQFAHVLGYANGGKGMTGLEYSYNAQLAGHGGVRQVEVTALGTIVREVSRIPAEIGNTVTIAIDSEIQRQVLKLFRGKQGSVVVTDLDDNSVLALVSSPTFNPNLLTGHISAAEWKHLKHSKTSPLINRAISNHYPPGSIWKIVSAMAFLESGIDPKNCVTCLGGMKIGNKVFRCWKKTGHGQVDMNRAIAESCNIYFYSKAMEVGIEPIHDMAHLLGFGAKTQIELPGEIAGINPNARWKSGANLGSWKLYDTVNSAIGQGHTLVTPMQLVQMMCRIATGDSTAPSIFRRSKGHSGNLVQSRHLNFIRSAMHGVVNSPNGTTYPLRFPDGCGYTFSGKTSTAQIVSRDTERVGAKSIKSHGLFAGFAPSESPKFAIVVVAENEGWGSLSAAPIAREILWHLMQKSR